MNGALLVAVGGMVGAVARFALDSWLTGRRATFAVNVLGSLVLGMVVTASVPETTATLVGTGFCGAFTTFSSFAVSVAERLQAGEYRRAATYAGGTLVSALVGVGGGAWLVSLV
ncbi:MAG: fluoride efflux transporter FluC [Halobacteriota archaeon]